MILAHKRLKIFSLSFFVKNYNAQTLFGAVILFVALLIPNFGFAKDSFGLDASQTAIVKKAQQYLNKMTTLKANFIQATSRGSFARGKLWVSVPGRMRFDYDPPVDILIVSDGRTVLFKDEALDQLSYTSFDSTPASMLLGGTVDFFGPKVLLTDFEKDGDSVRITAVREDDPQEGSLTMVFATSTMALIKWMIIDAQGIATTVSLLEPQFGLPINPDMFKVEQRSFQRNAD